MINLYYKYDFIGTAPDMQNPTPAKILQYIDSDEEVIPRDDLKIVEAVGTMEREVRLEDRITDGCDLFISS